MNICKLIYVSMLVYEINICELIYEKYNMGGIKHMLLLLPLGNKLNIY